MKKKILIGAFALLVAFFAIDSFSGQNQVKAGDPPQGNCKSDSNFFCDGPGTTCYCCLTC
jgi:hypothetical protein